MFSRWSSASVSIKSENVGKTRGLSGEAGCRTAFRGRRMMQDSYQQMSPGLSYNVCTQEGLGKNRDWLGDVFQFLHYPYTHICTIVAVTTPTGFHLKFLHTQEHSRVQDLSQGHFGIPQGPGIEPQPFFYQSNHLIRVIWEIQFFFSLSLHGGQESYMPLSTGTADKGVISQIPSRSEVLPLLSHFFGLYWDFGPKTSVACRCSWNTEAKITTWLNTIFLAVTLFHISHSVSQS